MAVEKNHPYTVKDLLKELGLSKKAFDAVGNGLNVGGLNIWSLEQELRVPEGTKSLIVLIPGEDPQEIEL